MTYITVVPGTVFYVIRKALALGLVAIFLGGCGSSRVEKEAGYEEAKAESAAEEAIYREGFGDGQGSGDDWYR